MKWWWVNHNQTKDQEVTGNYLWSPKKEKNGAHNQAYMNMTLVLPGDAIFSFADGYIGSLGIAVGRATESRKPKEFGSTGDNWAKVGWLLRASFMELPRGISPKSHLAEIRPLLPKKYSPIQANGNGNQKLYLTEISEQLGSLLLQLAGVESLTDVKQELTETVETAAAEREIASDQRIGPTEKMQLIAARRGQGRFKANVSRVERGCRVTGVSDINHLRASHIKPWRYANNRERLDGHNGLLLAPHVDYLFDKGHITFSDEGSLVLSPRLNKSILAAWGISVGINTGSFTTKQIRYLNFHRKKIFNKRSG